MLISSSLFCLLSFFSIFFFSHFMGKSGASFYACASLFGAVLTSFLGFFKCLHGVSSVVAVYNWFPFGLVAGGVDCSFIFDSLACSMIFLITLVSFLIHVYSTSYMLEDPHLPRFLAFLSLFTFFMLVLVSSDNFLIFFFAWEGVGICSYLLISFWFTRASAVRAGLEAILFNRVGDIGLLLSIILIYGLFHTLDFSLVFATAPCICTEFFLFVDKMQLPFFDGICMCMFLGVLAKSAQLGMHVWLPDAMEGPTPVSALLHSSTMVVAGVFVLLRCSPIFEFSPFVLAFVAVAGSLTAFFSASVGLVQNDIKKVIAYSTCSQLGYMVLACGLSCYQLSFFHLFNHAFFKSLLFLAAGAVIHSLTDEQDMRRMGSLLVQAPFVYAVVTLGAFSLSGFPFLSGYYSKDAILESCLVYTGSVSEFCGILGLAAAFLTSFYSFRLLYLTFLSDTRLTANEFFSVHTLSVALFFPLFVLAALSVFSGYFFFDLFIGPGTNFWVNSLFSLPFGLNLHFYEFVPLKYKAFPVALSLAGFLASYILYVYLFPLVAYFGFFFRNWFAFFAKRWYFDYFYYALAGAIFRFSYQAMLRSLDQGWFQNFFSFGLELFFTRASAFLFRLQTGYIYHYIFSMIFGILFFFLVALLALSSCMLIKPCMYDFFVLLIPFFFFLSN